MCVCVCGNVSWRNPRHERFSSFLSALIADLSLYSLGTPLSPLLSLTHTHTKQGGGSFSSWLMQSQDSNPNKWPRARCIPAMLYLVQFSNTHLSAKMRPRFFYRGRGAAGHLRIVFCTCSCAAGGGLFLRVHTRAAKRLC